MSRGGADIASAPGPLLFLVLKTQIKRGPGGTRLGLIICRVGCNDGSYKFVVKIFTEELASVASMVVTALLDECTALWGKPYPVHAALIISSACSARATLLAQF